MTDEQILELLQAIRALALLPYPYPKAHIGSAELALALGEIAGLATRARAEFLKKAT